MARRYARFRTKSRKNACCDVPCNEQPRAQVKSAPSAPPPHCQVILGKGMEALDASLTGERVKDLWTRLIHYQFRSISVITTSIIVRSS